MEVAISIAVIWIACIGTTITLLSARSIGEQNQFLMIIFPNSLRMRQVVGTILIVFAPISMAAFCVFLVFLGVWKIVNGSMFRSIKRSTGM